MNGIIGRCLWRSSNGLQNLDYLCEGWVGQEVGRVHGMARYKLSTSSSEEHRIHPHFVCSACGTVQCLKRW